MPDQSGKRTAVVEQRPLAHFHIECRQRFRPWRGHTGLLQSGGVLGGRQIDVGNLPAGLARYFGSEISERKRRIAGQLIHLTFVIAHEVVPPHVDYRLTPLGREAAEKVRGLTDWIEENLPRILQEQEARVESASRNNRPRK